MVKDNIKIIRLRSRPKFYNMEFALENKDNGSRVEFLLRKAFVTTLQELPTAIILFKEDSNYYLLFDFRKATWENSDELVSILMEIFEVCFGDSFLIKLQLTRVFTLLQGGFIAVKTSKVMKQIINFVVKMYSWLKLNILVEKCRNYFIMLKDYISIKVKQVLVDKEAPLPKITDNTKEDSHLEKEG